MPPRPGAYILLFTLTRPLTLPIGKKRTLHFPTATYVYVGSARNGLDQRITRHLRAEKKLHWHIDYLLPSAHTIHAYTTTNPKLTECRIAAALLQHHDFIPDFGNSDCACLSHLIHGPKKELTNTIRALTLTPYRPRKNILNHPHYKTH